MTESAGKSSPTERIHADVSHKLDFDSLVRCALTLPNTNRDLRSASALSRWLVEDMGAESGVPGQRPTRRQSKQDTKSDGPSLLWILPVSGAPRLQV